jgi:hypothetical protein
MDIHLKKLEKLYQENRCSDDEDEVDKNLITEVLQGAIEREKVNSN